MTAVVDHLTVIERLRPLLTAAVREAALLEQPVLVSATSRVAPVDGVELFTASLTGRRVFWEQPAEAFSILGVGAAARLAGQGRASVSEVSERWRRLLSTAVIDVDPACPVHPPVAQGGAAFDPGRAKPGSAWEAFPDAELVVPTFQLVSQGESSWLTTNAVVDAGEDVEAIAAGADRALRDLLSNRGRPALMIDETAGSSAEEDGGRERWLEGVTSGIAEIRRGVLEKVVLAREVRARRDGAFAPSKAIERLRTGYPSCTVFAFDSGNGCFLGATPERLVRLQGRRLDAACVAGSWRRGNTAEEDRELGQALLADEKERQEHELVVRAVRDALEPICSDLAIPATAVILDLPNLKHLHTPVQGVADDDTTVLDAVERLNPTPATGGLPREAALSYIRRIEPFDRGWYAGAVGWVDREGEGEFSVGIRSALLRDNEAILYAGCGIVSDSKPEQEYEESCVKLQPLRWALSLE